MKHVTFPTNRSSLKQKLVAGLSDDDFDADRVIRVVVFPSDSVDVSRSRLECTLKQSRSASAKLESGSALSLPSDLWQKLSGLIASRIPPSLSPRSHSEIGRPA